MNKEEVKFDHFKDIEELIKHLEMWYAKMIILLTRDIFI